MASWRGLANRHGLIAGATGMGKTVTLRVLAEHFSRIGVPIFMADVKGDLSGLCFPGGDKPKIAERVKELRLKNFSYKGYPVVFWDVEGVAGPPGAHNYFRNGASAFRPVAQSQ